MIAKISYKGTKKMRTKNRGNYLRESGITLVALVVTIVVLLILAGVSINAIFNENGIIKKAQEAQSTMNDAVENDTKGVDELNNLIDSHVNGTAGGEDTQTATENWTQNKTTVTDGTTTYTVGDDYTYDCGVSGYTGGWKVLGAEKGKLLIMSTVDVGTLGLKGISGDGTTSYPAGYTNGIDKLDEICKPYGTNARSITVEDINRVTGYTQEHQTISITSENKYYYDNDTANSSSTGSSVYSGTYGLADALEIKDKSPVTGNVWYYYYPYSLTTSSSTTGDCEGIKTDSPAYRLLFRNTDNTENCEYWLASSCMSANGTLARLAMRSVFSDARVNCNFLWNTNFGVNSKSLGVRAVVPL